MRWFSSISGNSEKIAVLLSRAIDMVGGLIFLKLISTHASKADMGTYLLATSVVALLLTVSFSALSQGVLRNVSEYLKSGELRKRYTAVLIGYLITAPVYALLALNLIEALGISKSLSQYIYLIVIWVASDALKTLNTSVAAAMRQRYLIAASSVLDYSVKLGGIGLCIHGGNLDTTMIIVIMTAASATVGLFFILTQKGFLGRTNFSLCITTLKEAAHFAWPMVIWGAFGWAQNMSSRWIIEYHQGVESVAAFGVLTTVGSLPVNALFGVVITYIQPIIYELETNKPGSSLLFLKKTIKKIAPVFLTIIGVSIFFHQQIISLVTSAKYADLSQHLPWIVTAVTLSSIGSTLSYFALARKKGSTLIVANTLPGLFNLILGFILIPRYQVEGAIIAMVISHLMLFFLLAHSFIMHNNMSILTFTLKIFNASKKNK